MKDDVAPAGFALEGAQPDDFEALLALRLRAMRESLERLGRYDEQRARERLAENFEPAHTRHIVVGGRRVGFLVLKTLSHAMRLNHLYIDPAFQRRGIGHRVLQWVCAEADRQQLPVELMALKGSEAYVMINVANEPFGNNTTSQWEPFHAGAVAKLRTAGLHHTLIVDAPNWGQDWSYTMRDGSEWRDGEQVEQAKLQLLAIPFTPSYAEYIYLKGRRVLADQMEYLLAHFPRSSPLHKRLSTQPAAL